MLNKRISIIVPAYNEEGNIKLISEQIIKNISKAVDKYEIIFINDGSTDRTLKKIKLLAKSNKNIKYVSFSKNFGHQSALIAGINSAKGDAVISMDCDMQHPPKIILDLIKKWQEGYEVVYTIRDDSNTIFFKKISSRFFYFLMNKLSNLDIENGVADFRLLDRKVVNEIINLNESVIFLRGMVVWLGFKQCGIKYVPAKRYSGKTKYSMKKMINFAITGITSFSTKPLELSVYIGSVFLLISLIYGFYAIIMFIFKNNVITGWTSLILSILFFGGIQLIMLGIIGVYIGKIFIETKKRPNYIIKETNI